MVFSFPSCFWMQILVDAQIQKQTNSGRLKLSNHISIFCTILHHGGAWTSSQEHPSLQWAASPICSSQDRTQTQHPASFCCNFKHRAGKALSTPHPPVASNPQLLTWFYSHNTSVRKENFIPVVLETEPTTENRFAEYHLNTLPCLLFVSFDGILAAVPKPSLKKSPLFPSSFPAGQTQKEGNPPSVLLSAPQVWQEEQDFSMQLNKTQSSCKKKKMLEIIAFLRDRGRDKAESR